MQGLCDVLDFHEGFLRQQLYETYLREEFETKCARVREALSNVPDGESRYEVQHICRTQRKF